MKTFRIKVQETHIVEIRYDYGEAEEGWIVCEEFPEELLYSTYGWLYIDSKFVKESEEDIRKREEEERRIAQRNAPVLLQTQYITREEFNLLSYQDTNTLYYIIEEDGTATMQKGVN